MLVGMDRFFGQRKRKVDFLICGTQRGGTSALYRYVREHPEICWARRKEVHYFDSERHFRRKPQYSKYHSFFNPQSSHKVLGEATPAYMYWYDAPRRIWEYNPSIKLIIILRNPIDRAYSHWNLLRHRTPNVSFWEAIQNERERCRSALPLQHRSYSYVDRGFYLEQLRRLWTYFEQKQMLILRNEDLRRRPQEVVDKICRFLEINPLPELKPAVEHQPRYPYSGPMGVRERDYLRHIFEYEIRDLERVLGWDCSRWLAD
ncbi:MAG: sulfotransferase domain-containing protein [Candidatus Binatia bacterium]